MSDQSDCESALVGILSGLIYPNGSGQSPAQGIAAQIMPGWPVPGAVDALMAEGAACVWVYARPEVKDTTRYPMVWQTPVVVPATLTATVSGNKVTIGGAMPSPFSPHNIFVLLAGQAFGYPLQTGDSLSSVASALASLIAVAFPGTTSSGTVITVTSGAILTARVGTVGTTIEEVGRFEQSFQVVIAASTPAARAALAGAILPMFMQMNFVTMPDGMAARLRVLASNDVDSGQKAGIFRRDIRVAMEYAVTTSQTTATVEAVQVSYPGTNIPSRSY